MSLMHLSTVCPDVTVCQITLFSQQQIGPTHHRTARRIVCTSYCLSVRRQKDGAGQEGMKTVLWFNHSAYFTVCRLKCIKNGSVSMRAHLTRTCAPAFFSAFNHENDFSFFYSVDVKTQKQTSLAGASKFNLKISIAGKDYQLLRLAECECRATQTCNQLHCTLISLYWPKIITWNEVKKHIFPSN